MRELSAAPSTSAHSNCKPSSAPELPGDYNGNHAVDAADYVLWRKTMGADVPQYSGADGNGSSKIDDADYDVWRGHFGAPASASAAVAATQSNLSQLPNRSRRFSRVRQCRTAQCRIFALLATLDSRYDLPSAQSNSHRQSSCESKQVWRSPLTQSTSPR